MGSFRTRPHRFPKELAQWVERIRGYAVDYNLDFFEVIFELLDYDELNEVAAYGGFPTRYPHWKWGMAYEELSKGYSYGLSKIYELVINNDPCYAYLMRQNALVDQKLVIAHVYGHSDFFKNNYWFSETNRKMLDEMANHATRVRRYIERYGQDKVERFIDACLSLENLIDSHGLFIKRRQWSPDEFAPEEAPPTVAKLPSKEYMDRYVNPPQFIEAQRKKLQEEIDKQKHFPEEPEKDILWFLIQHAPLERWQRDVLSIIREEAYYFLPQGMTKIMNEGWASYWHSTIMTERALEDSEIIDYADHHAGTMGTRPGVLNPYKVGLELFRYIEERWDKGQFGKEWRECDDIDARRDYDRDLGIGRDKIFQVRKIYNDVLFIDEFLTKEFCEEHKLFVYEYNEQMGQYVIADRDFQAIKKKLLFSLTNFGQPHIEIHDANYKNRGELYLVHQHEGVDLKDDYARDTLENLQRIWNRPVHIQTVVDKRPKILSYDGTEHSDEAVKRPAAPVEVDDEDE